jgi:putative phosphoribosyl transferase
MKPLLNRKEAGIKLAETLDQISDGAVVLAVPRGGVVVGFEVAKKFGIPLDIIITKKIGAPGNPEFAIGAVAEDGTLLLDDNLVQSLNVSEEYIQNEVERQKNEIKRRLESYRGKSSAPEIAGRQVILVDDGVATGSTLKVALRSLRRRGAHPLVVAVPVGPVDTCKELEKEADRVICLHTPEPFYAIGQFYEDFDQTNDEEVKESLSQSRMLHQKTEEAY